MRGPRDRRRTKNRPLGAYVINGVLTIEIGVDVLAFAALNEYADDGGLGQRGENYDITNNEGFARDVVRALLDEEEDGSSLLTELFDKAVQDAIDDGAEHFEPIEESEK